MNVGELFVTLGIKGADAAGKAVEGVTKSVTNLSFSAFASKAAIMGVVYGLGKLAEFAAGSGMAMMKFTNYTGISTDLLQRWQVAGLKFGVTSEEMASNLQNVQSVMAKMQTGQGAPTGWATISTEAGIDWRKVNDMKYMMEKLGEYARNTKTPIGQANDYLKSFGLSEATIAMLRKNKIELDKIPQSLIMTTRELENQSKVKASWDILWRQMEIAGQRFAMMYAPQAVKALGGAFNWVLGVTNNIIKLTKAMPELGVAAKAIGLVLAIAFAPVTTILTGVILLLNELQKMREGKDNLFTDINKGLLGGKEGETAQEKTNRLDDFYKHEK